MEAGTLPLGLGAPLFSCFQVESIVPDLLRLLHSPSSTLETRLIAFAGLGGAKVDLIRELEALDRETRDTILASMRQLKEAMAVARGGGGPFRALLKVDPANRAAVEEQGSAIVQQFLESDQGKEVPNPEEARPWIHEFLVIAHSPDVGTPITMTGSDVEDVLSEWMPGEVSGESEEEGLPASPAIEACFRWVAEVA